MHAPRSFRTALVLAFAASTPVAPATEALPAPAPVAVAYKVSGAAVRQAASKRTALKAPDWLNAGDRVIVEDGARVLLAAIDGRRWELAPATVVLVGEDGIETLRGKATPLGRLPSMLKLAPILASPGRPSATRIRGESLTVLSPPPGGASLARGTTLTFRGHDGPADVSILGEDGKLLFRVSVRAGTLPIPPGVLAPGSRYFWGITSADADGHALEASGAFTTLTEDQEDARRKLIGAVERLDDRDALGVVEAIDRRLGLTGDRR